MTNNDDDELDDDDNDDNARFWCQYFRILVAVAAVVFVDLHEVIVSLLFL